MSKLIGIKIPDHPADIVCNWETHLSFNYMREGLEFDEGSIAHGMGWVPVHGGNLKYVTLTFPATRDMVLVRTIYEDFTIKDSYHDLQSISNERTKGTKTFDGAYRKWWDDQVARHILLNDIPPEDIAKIKGVKDDWIVE